MTFGDWDTARVRGQGDLIGYAFGDLLCLPSTLEAASFHILNFYLGIIRPQLSTCQFSLVLQLVPRLRNGLPPALLDPQCAR